MLSIFILNVFCGTVEVLKAVDTVGDTVDTATYAGICCHSPTDKLY